MAKFKVELSSGKSIVIEDERSLTELAEELCNDGFIQVLRVDKSGYQPATNASVALLERAVASIEPT